jgi:HAD superfamily hydrolase (TIGR01450 family)
VIEGEGNRGEWTEVAMQRLLRSGAMPMRPFDIGGRAWAEIDSVEDLVAADGAFSALDLDTIKLAFLDLDGTIYLGDEVLPGAMGFLDELKRRGIARYFLSNNSSKSKRDYVARLERLGIAASAEEILLSSDGLIQHLLDEGVTRTYVVGTESLREAFRETGIDPESDSPACVVLGYDTELTYEKLRRAALHMLDGVELLMTHCDVVCPTPDGPIPDAGSMQALLTKATGREPARIFGKPNAEMIAHVIARCGVSPAEAMMVGDRLYTDMAMAAAAGCRSVLVLTGETTRADLESVERFPDLVAASAGAIFDARNP